MGAVEFGGTSPLRGEKEEGKERRFQFTYLEEQRLEDI